MTIAAQARGTLADPQISGTVRAQDASLQSPATGMALSHVSASGAFDGAQLRLSDIAGQTAGGGKVSGAATFTFSSERGIGMDVALETDHAVLLDRDDVGATVSGPVRIRSTGGTGTISGDLNVVSSRFMLGRAATVAEIPQMRLIEINRAGDESDADPLGRALAARYQGEGGLLSASRGPRHDQPVVGRPPDRRHRDQPDDQRHGQSGHRQL